MKTELPNISKIHNVLKNLLATKETFLILKVSLEDLLPYLLLDKGIQFPHMVNIRDQRVVNRENYNSAIIE